MKVLHVTHTFFPDSRGGVEEVVRQICLNTEPYDVESRIFTLSRTPTPKVVEIDNVLVFRAKLNIEISSCGFSLNALSDFKDLIDWADVVHYHHPWPFADFLHLYCKVTKKTVVTYHSDIVRQKILKNIYGPLMHYFFKRVNKIVATSSNYLESSLILQRYKNKVEIIPIGINEESYPKSSSKDIEFVKSIVGNDFFLFIGMFRQYKGLHYLLKALVNNHAKVVIAGTGGLEKKLKRQANILGLTNVHFVGSVNSSEKSALLKLCSGVIFSSHLRSEAFGVTLIEGAMHSKPLISTELGTGSSYVNLDGITGHVVQPSNHEELKNAIEKLFFNPQISKKMGLKARARYDKEFTGTIMGSRYYELYKNLFKN